LAVLACGCSPPAPPPTTPPAPNAQRSSLSERPITALAAPPASSEPDVIARVGTKVITKDQILAPLLEAHGLNLMLHLAQLELARQAATEKGITVTSEDFKQERELTFARMFKESDDQIREKIKEAKEKGDAGAVEKLESELKIDRESLLDQYLVQQYAQTHQYVTRQEFDLVLQMNTYLRKIAEATPELKNAVTDDVLQKAFAARYGEKIVVRHIQANDIGVISNARRRIQAGENFADVARDLSTNKNTAPLGGAIPPFTMNATNVPQVFKDAAFALKNGEVSDVVHADNAYHLIKVESRIAPKVVKFEDVKESLRADLQDQILQAAVKQLRDKVVAQMVSNLQVENPVLKAQYAEKRDEANRLRDQAKLDEAMKRDRPAEDKKPQTQPVPAK
jgi:parvulin-like peptidyl-prolyl isomerase